MQKNKDALRFGVIGCGGMATLVHVPNMANMENAETVAYCDLDKAKAQNLLKTHGGGYVTKDADRIFKDKTINGVLIQVGPSLHPKLVQAAAKAGKHIFVEKPIAIELKDALETVRVVEQSGVKFIFGVCNRLAPAVKLAKRMCPRPCYSYCQCSDSITHQAVHNLDLAVNLFHDSPLELVYASGGRFWETKSDAHLPADSFTALLTFADKSTHTYLQHGNSFNPMLKKYHYQLFGRDCCVYLAQRFKECHLMKTPDKAECSWIFNGSDTDRGPFGYMGHYDEIKELVDCILNGGNGTMTVRDAAYVLAVEKAILYSLHLRKAIDFKMFLREHNADFLLKSRR